MARKNMTEKLFLIDCRFQLTMKKLKIISELKSLGPKSQDMLARAGITSIEQLQKLGAIAAYAKTKKVNANASLNLLWALESALTGEPWQEVARLHRTSLLLALEDYEKMH
jgi:DNA transformation protein and related proteins